MRKFSSQLGFTMIELLIVITILGILAVAVLSAINPIEQINRGRDTGSQSDAEQLLSAIDRYNAFQGYYPWQLDANDTDTSMMASAYNTEAVPPSWTRQLNPTQLVDNALGLPVPVTYGGDVAFPTTEIFPDDDTNDAVCSIMERLSSGRDTTDQAILSKCRGAQELKDSFVTRIHNPSTRDLFIYNSGVSGGSTYVCFIPQSGAFEVAASDRCDDGLPEDIGVPAQAFICAREISGQIGEDLRAGVGVNSSVPMSCLP